jgi:predicted site-specific integrase-resolvase
VKLSACARQIGVSYPTAWRWFKAGKLTGFRADAGSIVVTDPGPEKAQVVAPCKVTIHTRVSAAENKANLEGQAERWQDYCAAKGYPVAAVVREVGSGVNDTRPNLLRLLTDRTITLIGVEHKGRLTRFGFNFIEQLLKLQDQRLEVVNLAENAKEDLIQDFVSIVTSFCARRHDRRRSKRKTERLISELQ